MCCDGSIFTKVALTPGDGDKRVRLAIASEATHMPLPCAHLISRRCGVYEARPDACAAFACDLLGRFDEGSIELDEALVIVERVRALRAELEALLPPDSASVWDRVARATARLRPGEAAPWLLLAADLRIRLTRDFRDPIRQEGDFTPPPVGRDSAGGG